MAIYNYNLIVNVQTHIQPKGQCDFQNLVVENPIFYGLQADETEKTAPDTMSEISCELQQLIFADFIKALII